MTTLTPYEYQAALLVSPGIDVDWCKTNPGRSAVLKARELGISVPKLFKDRGFSHIRIRITEDVIHDPTLLEEIKLVVAECFAANLIPIIAYQAECFKNNPTSDHEISNVVAWWAAVDNAFDPNLQIAFNIVIETTGLVKDNNDKLNQLYQRVADDITTKGNNRILIFAPNNISNPYSLPKLIIPECAKKICLVEWHQLASGISKSGSKDKLWTNGTEKEKQTILDKINFAAAWSKENNIPSWSGAWMCNNYNSDEKDPDQTHYDGAPTGGDYSIAEQVVFAKFMCESLKKVRIPHAVNSDTKYFDRQNNVWYKSVELILNAILERT